MLTQIPGEFILRKDLSLIERAAFPIVVQYTAGWGMAASGVNIKQINDILDVDVKELMFAMERLCTAKLLQKYELKEHGQRLTRYRLHEEYVAFVHNPNKDNTPETITEHKMESVSTVFYINMPDSKMLELQRYAKERLAKSGLSQDIFDDFNLFHRSRNTKSMDWISEFERWVRRENQGNIAPSSQSEKFPVLREDAKPSPEEFAFARYFHEQHKAINKHHQEPFNMQLEGFYVKSLLETSTYSIDDLKKGLEWLFGPKGDFYRPNVPNTKKLLERFDYIYSHSVNYTDKDIGAAGEHNVFDVIDKMERD